eukprot:6205636-Pleurochrysis_carterae.AAC.10
MLESVARTGGEEDRGEKRKRERGGEHRRRRRIESVLKRDPERQWEEEGRDRKVARGKKSAREREKEIRQKGRGQEVAWGWNQGGECDLQIGRTLEQTRRNRQ